MSLYIGWQSWQGIAVAWEEFIIVWFSPTNRSDFFVCESTKLLPVTYTKCTVLSRSHPSTLSLRPLPSAFWSMNTSDARCSVIRGNWRASTSRRTCWGAREMLSARRLVLAEKRSPSLSFVPPTSLWIGSHKFSPRLFLRQFSFYPSLLARKILWCIQVAEPAPLYAIVNSLTITLTLAVIQQRFRMKVWLEHEDVCRWLCKVQNIRVKLLWASALLLLSCPKRSFERMAHSHALSYSSALFPQQYRHPNLNKIIHIWW